MVCQNHMVSIIFIGFVQAPTKIITLFNTRRMISYWLISLQKAPSPKKLNLLQNPLRHLASDMYGSELSYKLVCLVHKYSKKHHKCKFGEETTSTHLDTGTAQQTLTRSAEGIAQAPIPPPPHDFVSRSSKLRCYCKSHHV